MIKLFNKSLFKNINKLQIRTIIDVPQHAKEQFENTNYFEGDKPWLNPYFPANSTLLPLQKTFIKRRYPFNIRIKNQIPIQNVRQLSSDPPRFKSELQVDVNKLKLTLIEKEILKNLVGTRYNIKIIY